MGRKLYGNAAKLITETTAGALLLRGHLWLRANRADDALAAFKRIRKAPPGLHDFLLIRTAQALLFSQDPEGALEVLKKVKKPKLTDSMHARLTARALRESGQLDKGRAAYRALIKQGRRGDIPVALLGLARLEAEAKNPAGAYECLRRLDLEYPIHWARSRAETLIGSLKTKSKEFALRWKVKTPEEQIAQAERYLKAHQNRAAVDRLKPLTGRVEDADLRCRQLYSLGRALRKLRRWTEARPLLNKAIAACAEAKNELEPWARHIAGQADERLSDELGAARHFRRQMERHPTHRLADDGGYFVIRHIVDDLKDLKQAEKELGKLVTKFPAGDMMPHAVFFVAVNAFSQGKYRQALRVLKLEEKLVLKPANYRRMGRTKYWQGRILAKLGRRKAARAKYEAAFREFPLSWYSVLAYSRLREGSRRRANRLARTVLTKSTRLSFLDGKSPVGARWDTARALARLGLPSSAWSVLRRASLEEPHKKWRAARLLDQAGAVHLSHDILRRRLSEFRSYAPAGPTREAWKTAFPFPFARLVDESAKSAGIQPTLVRSIMREESGFNPGIESSANAVGLMQLILKTGRGMAQKGEGPINSRTLKRPDLNVRLGARYLARVLNRSGAVPALVPAGYNAGTGALKRWLRARAKLPLDLFVELIPYEEARGYTKRVNSTRAVYRYLYGKSKYPLYLSQSTMRAPDRRKNRKKVQSRKRRRRGSK